MIFTDAIKTVLIAHLRAENQTLLVDRDSDLALQLKDVETWFLHPSELWSYFEPPKKLIILSAPRSAHELFTVLVLCDRIISSDGTILLLPYATEFSTESRIEATEIFCGAYPHWERRLVEGFIVELRKKQQGFSPTAKITPLSSTDAKWTIQTTTKSIKKVISLSLFNDYRDLGEHWKRLPDMVRCFVLAHHALFPGYELRIHHDEAIYHSNAGDLLHGFARRELVTLTYVPSRPGQGKCQRMLDRLRPAWDPDVDFVFCRDLDSIPTIRDRMACEEFIDSHCALGVLHDNAMHAGILGGLCHVHAPAFRKAVGHATFSDFITSANFDDAKWAVHGSDQELLNQIAPKMPSILEHSLVSWPSEDGKTNLHRKPTWPQSDFRTQIAELPQKIIRELDPIIIAKSNNFIHYLGAAGYDLDEALEFYQNRSPMEF